MLNFPLTGALAIEPAAGANLIARIQDQLATGADVLNSVVGANSDAGPQGLQTRGTTMLDGRKTVALRGDVAIIPLIGVISRYDDWISRWLCARSVAALALDLAAALENPGVRRIVLEVDSPGGDVTGICELANFIRAANRKKPVTAYVGGTAASAAYWLASAAGRIVVSETALLGSIGVVISARDTRQRDEKAGVRTIHVVSTQSPDKRLDIASDDGRGKMQVIVDELADVFVRAVAGFRNKTVEGVLRDFGRGGSLVGAAAVKAGMADSLGTLEGFIAGHAPKPVPASAAGRVENPHSAALPTFDIMGTEIFARRRVG